jgi:sirohydrochlorin ferrochelatase
MSFQHYARTVAVVLMEPVSWSNRGFGVAPERVVTPLRESRGKTVALQFLAVYFAPLARLLGVVPLAAGDWIVVLPLALLPAVVGQGIAVLESRRRV